MTPAAVGTVNAAIITAIARALFSKPQNGAEFLEELTNRIDERVRIADGDIRAALEATREILMAAGA